MVYTHLERLYEEAGMPLNIVQRPYPIVREQNFAEFDRIIAISRQTVFDIVLSAYYAKFNGVCFHSFANHVDVEYPDRVNKGEVLSGKSYTIPKLFVMEVVFRYIRYLGFMIDMAQLGKIPFEFYWYETLVQTDTCSKTMYTKNQYDFDNIVTNMDEIWEFYNCQYSELINICLEDFEREMKVPSTVQYDRHELLEKL